MRRYERRYLRRQSDVAATAAIRTAADNLVSCLRWDRQVLRGLLLAPLLLLLALFGCHRNSFHADEVHASATILESARDARKISVCPRSGRVAIRPITNAGGKRWRLVRAGHYNGTFAGYAFATQDPSTCDPDYTAPGSTE